MSIHIFHPDRALGFDLQYVGSQISAGFPSPAEDYLEATLSRS